jgi:glycosyltransferase involved in cell wall biosynthesis
MNLLKIIIPCFNEKDSMKLLIQNLKTLNKEIKFIIVNNGSTDGTKEYLDSVSDTLGGNIEVFNIDLNLGYGDGVYRGLVHSKYTEYSGWIHGDLQFEFLKLNEIFEELKMIEDKKEKIFIKGIRIDRPMSDKLFSYFMGIIASFILKKPFKEINAQPTIFSSTLLEEVTSPPVDFCFDTYIYWLALKNEFTLVRKNFKFPPRQYGESKWNFGLKTRLKFSSDLIKYFVKLRRLDS